jgi:hypothetical protein
MTSLAHDKGNTFAPFREAHQSIGRVMLLADNLFRVPQLGRESPPRENTHALVSGVVQIPSRARFEAAVDRWFADTVFDSLPDEMKQHESFREIILGGNTVVPLIAAHLRRSPSFLFLALEEIFQESPIDEEDYGDLRTVVSAWLRWLQR